MILANILLKDNVNKLLALCKWSVFRLLMCCFFLCNNHSISCGTLCMCQLAPRDVAHPGPVEVGWAQPGGSLLAAVSVHASVSHDRPQGTGGSLLSHIG